MSRLIVRRMFVGFDSERTDLQRRIRRIQYAKSGDPEYITAAINAPSKFCLGVFQNAKIR